MYVDNENLFTATAIDLEGTNGAIVYGDQAINMGSTKDPGGGRPMYMVICIDEAVTSATNIGTIVFTLLDEEDNTITTTSVEIVQTDPLLVGRLTLGKVIVLPIPFGLITQQWLGVKITIGGEDTTAGTATIFLALDAFTNPGA